ncbi:MAG TPA: hypothetical protein DCL47_05450, partial [Pantoea agglomerans]|nr:hypothetical protein [Pantoea agglomerans]
MQRARCYLLGERAVVLELEPPVSLESQQRIWGLNQRLHDYASVLEVIPGMNNITLILRDPQQSALDAIERLQRWWEESEAQLPASRRGAIPVIYRCESGPDLTVAADTGALAARHGVGLHSRDDPVRLAIGFM